MATNLRTLTMNRLLLAGALVLAFSAPVLARAQPSAAPSPICPFLVVLEEVPDLLDQDLREVAIAANPLVVGM
jgi:hypothetical protein